MTTRWVAAVVAVAALALGAPAAHGAIAVTTPAVPSGMPTDVPIAALRPEPTLPTPRSWPTKDAFPRTSGTGREANGAEYWTDWIYDDHGALGSPEGNDIVEAGSPSFGGYSYPAGPADNNGADIFRAAVALTRTTTVWRVDWNTLADPTVPIAEWTFDTDANAATGGSKWPANAGVRSPGIDRALVVSSHVAQLIDPTSGAVIQTYRTTVDMRSRSFVVTIPNTVLHPANAWVIRLAAGLANAQGTAFAPARGALPTEPNVYNITFRSIAQEPVADNFWDDLGQAQTLLTGDVSKFALRLDWTDLEHRVTTPEVQPTGWSDRWYASSIELGQGELTAPGDLENGMETYLGRVQPYAIYVPTTYNKAKPAPLTFLLHSSLENHNQYAATTPRFSAAACEARGSICVTTLARGPSEGLTGSGQLDFWEVWHQVADAFTLNPERTITAGYSLGGIDSKSLAIDHPDLFAAAILLAGASPGDEPDVDNLRWVPAYLAGGAADELVPVTQEISLADGLARRGYQYRWLLYPAEDHVVLELQDGFSDAAAYMVEHPVRTVDPGHITFRWSAADDDPAFGYGITGAYWLQDLRATPGGSAFIDATSEARPDPTITTSSSVGLLVPGDPTPAVVHQLTWTLGATPKAQPVITLDLTDVAGLTVDLAGAGIAAGQPFQLSITTNVPTVISVGGRDLHVTKSETLRMTAP